MTVDEEPFSLIQMAEYFESQGYITDDIFHKILQAPKDSRKVKQLLQAAFKDAKKESYYKMKETLANRGDDSCKSLLQELNGRNKCILI